MVCELFDRSNEGMRDENDVAFPLPLPLLLLLLHWKGGRSSLTYIHTYIHTSTARKKRKKMTIISSGGGHLPASLLDVCF